MIKLKIERYRDYTEEENKARKEYIRARPYDGFQNVVPERCVDNVLDIEITDNQFEAIRKAVLEVF
jgi:hypothetical protein